MQYHDVVCLHLISQVPLFFREHAMMRLSSHFTGFPVLSEEPTILVQAIFFRTTCRSCGFQRPRAPRDGKPSNNVSPEQHTPHVQGCQGQSQAPKTGIRAPHPDEKVAVAQERVSKLEAAVRVVADDDDTAPSQRGVEESPPTSSASVIPDKVAQC